MQTGRTTSILAPIFIGFGPGRDDRTGTFGAWRSKSDIFIFVVHDNSFILVAEIVGLLETALWNLKPVHINNLSCITGLVDGFSDFSDWALIFRYQVDDRNLMMLFASFNYFFRVLDLFSSEFPLSSLDLGFFFSELIVFGVIKLGTGVDTIFLDFFIFVDILVDFYCVWCISLKTVD